MKTYSQYGEDQIIQKAFEERPSDTSRFLDIGAWHPTIFSNSRALIEQGWTGVIIEPSPGPFINLLRCCVKCGDVPGFYLEDGNCNGKIYVPGEVHVEVDGKMPVPPMTCEKCGGTRYGVEERLTFILAGVGLEPRLEQLHATHDALSTSDQEQYEKWSKAGGFYGRYLCPLISLEQISNQFDGFDFINIDTEGVSCDLFMKALDLGWRPRVWSVELDKGREHQVYAAATRAGYVAHTTQANVVLVQR